MKKHYRHPRPSKCGTAPSIRCCSGVEPPLPSRSSTLERIRCANRHETSKRLRGFGAMPRETKYITKFPGFLSADARERQKTKCKKENSTHTTSRSAPRGAKWPAFFRVCRAEWKTACVRTTAHGSRPAAKLAVTQPQTVAHCANTYPESYVIFWRHKLRALHLLSVNERRVSFVSIPALINCLLSSKCVLGVSVSKME